MAVTIGTGEHRIEVPDEPKDLAESALPEKQLNCFVRVVAFFERAGDAFGTLAFLWGTAVLLGGFCASLGSDDFWIVTFLIFIEAFRVFSRNYRLDDQSLFMTTRAITRLRLSLERVSAQLPEWNELVATLGLLGIVLLESVGSYPLFNSQDVVTKVMLALIILMNKLPLPGAPQLMTQLRRHRRGLLWGILIALILLFVFRRKTLAAEAVLPLHVMTVFLLIFRPQRIANLTNHPRGRKLLSSAKLILATCLVVHQVLWPFDKGTLFLGLSAIPLSLVVISLASLQIKTNRPLACCLDIALHVCFFGELVSAFSGISSVITFAALLVLLVVGNLQIPAAITRVVLSSILLSSLTDSDDYGHDTNPNLVPSIAVFYVLVICQGTQYIIACILELFSFFPCRLLVRSSELRGQRGGRAVDLYYHRAYVTCMETGVLAARDSMKMSLASFAIDSLRSSSREFQLVAVRVLDSLLQRRDDSGEELISRITGSREVVSTLIAMLGWTAVRDTEVRLLAARVTANLAGRLRAVLIPGIVKMLSSLLDAESQMRKPDSLVANGSENDRGNVDDSLSELSSSSAQFAGDSEIEGNARSGTSRQESSPQTVGVNGECVEANGPLGQESSAQSEAVGGGNAVNQPTQDNSAHIGSNNGWRFLVWRHWQRMKERWSIPDELPWTHEDSFPVLGMLILERLAYDLENCAEIGKATYLISKIIGFISYNTDTANDDNVLQTTLICSSLNLVRRLSVTGGEVGTTLRQQLWECPFLLSNLACILEDGRSSSEILELAMDIIAKLAFDEDARHDIGSSQGIIGKLIYAFLGREGSANIFYDHKLRAAAGEALANLSIGNAANCMAILKEPGYELINDLMDMLCDDEHRYAAASLLQNLFPHSIDELQGPNSNDHLPSALHEVMKQIKVAEGKQLEALIGLSSHICNATPELFVHSLELQFGVSAFVQKLRAALDANKRPCSEYPRMRRVTVQMVISFVTSCPRYAPIFREQGMMEALSKVERTPSKVEKYRIFFGYTGVDLESGEPLPLLVARAKGLIGSET